MPFLSLKKGRINKAVRRRFGFREITRVRLHPQFPDLIHIIVHA